MSGLHVVEAQSLSQRVDHLVGDVRLAPLLQAAVVIGAEPGGDRKLLLPQPWHATRAWKRMDAGLVRREAVTPGPEERPELGIAQRHFRIVPADPAGTKVDPRRPGYACPGSKAARGAKPRT